MQTLLYTEWLKIRKYPAFWWMLGIVLLSYPGVNYLFYQLYKTLLSKGGQQAAIIKSLVGNPFAFPEVWHTVAYASSLLIMIPALLIIMFITNEYGFKTHRQNIIDGWSRRQFAAAKFIDVMAISLLATIIFFVVALVTGFINDAEKTGGTWDNSNFVGLYFLQTFTQLSLAFLLAFVTRKAFIALGIFLFYFIILEPVAVGLARLKANDAGRFLPLEIADRLIPVPSFLGKLDEKSYQGMVDNISQHVILSIGLLLFIWLTCFYLVAKRDL